MPASSVAPNLMESFLDGPVSGPDVFQHSPRRLAKGIEVSGISGHFATVRVRLTTSSRRLPGSAQGSEIDRQTVLQFLPQVGKEGAFADRRTARGQLGEDRRCAGRVAPGGMGEVWLTSRPNDGRCSSEQPGRRRGRGRFRREAHAVRWAWRHSRSSPSQ